jgi:homoserine kinase
LKSGALAVTISGAGPSMISFLKTSKNGKQVANSMAAGFNESNIKSRIFVCRTSHGAKVLAVK